LLGALLSRFPWRGAI